MLISYACETWFDLKEIGGTARKNKTGIFKRIFEKWQRLSHNTSEF